MLVAACVADRLADCFRSRRSRSSAFRNRSFAARRSRWCRRSSVSQALSLTAIGGSSMPSTLRCSDSGELGPRIALIQGNSLAEWKHDPNRERQIMEEYIELSEQAVSQARERRRPAGRSDRLAGNDVSHSARYVRPGLPAAGERGELRQRTSPRMRPHDLAGLVRATGHAGAGRHRPSALPRCCGRRRRIADRSSSTRRCSSVATARSSARTTKCIA